MPIRIGAGWELYHLSDRCVELRKPDYLYERFLGRPGFVRVRGEPGMARADLVERAIVLAKQNDAALALRATKVLVPTAHALAQYAGQQVRFKRAFATPDDLEVIGVKRG